MKASIEDAVEAKAGSPESSTSTTSSTTTSSSSSSSYWSFDSLFDVEPNELEAYEKRSAKKSVVLPKTDSSVASSSAALVNDADEVLASATPTLAATTLGQPQLDDTSSTQERKSYSEVVAASSKARLAGEATSTSETTEDASTGE